MAGMQNITVSTDDQIVTLLVDENSAKKLIEDQNYLRHYVENLKNIGVLKCNSTANDGNDKLTKSSGSTKATEQNQSPFTAVTVNEDTVKARANSQSYAANGFTDRTALMTINDNTSMAQGSSQSSGANDACSEWNRNATVLLISTRLEMESEFQKPIQKNKLWNKISNTMKEYGYIFESAECHTKWRNLMSTYRKNVDKSKESGASSIRWEHYSLFHEVYGNRSNINPPDMYLRSSLPSCSSTHNECLSPQERLSSHDSPVETPTRKRNGEEPPIWFQKYLQKKEDDDKQKAELEEQRLQRLEDVENKKN